jgi:hypothetical protein
MLIGGFCNKNISELIFFWNTSGLWPFIHYDYSRPTVQFKVYLVKINQHLWTEEERQDWLHSLPTFRDRIKSSIAHIQAPEWSDDFKALKKKKDITNYPDQDPQLVELVQKAHAKLLDILTNFGGCEVATPPLEEDIVEILIDGRLVHGVEVQIKTGLNKQSHWNAARNYIKKPHSFIMMTGYALVQNGIWVAHSWNVLKIPDKEPIIIETTRPMVAYFGFSQSYEMAMSIHTNDPKFATGESYILDKLLSIKDIIEPKEAPKSNMKM